MPNAKNKKETRMNTQEELKKKLQALSKEDLIKLLLKAHKSSYDTALLIDKELITSDSASEILNHIGLYTPGECKVAITQKAKAIKDKKEKVLCYYSFVEEVLRRKNSLDARFIGVASATYGKAMDVLAKDRDLWDELFETSFSIAEKFYAIGGAVAMKAVEYYSNVKNGHDKSGNDIH